MTDNRKLDILLYGDSRFDENKNKIYSGSNHKLFEKSRKIFWIPF